MTWQQRILLGLGERERKGEVGATGDTFVSTTNRPPNSRIRATSSLAGAWLLTPTPCL